MPRLSGRTVLRNNNPPATEEKTQGTRGKALPSPPLSRKVCPFYPSSSITTAWEA